MNTKNTTRKTVLAASIILFFSAPIAHAEEFTHSVEQVQNEVVVQYDTGVLPHGNYSHEYVSDEVDGDPSTDTWKLKIDDGASVESVVEELMDSNKVQQAAPVGVRYATVDSNDTDFLTQWHHYYNFGVESAAAWDDQTGSSDVVIAVVDSGIDTDHPDLEDNMWVNTGEIVGNGIDDDGNGYVDDVHGYDFVADNGDPNPDPDGIDNDDFGGADGGVDHGTHVAGIIGAQGNNSLGVSGIMWDVQLMALLALDDEGSGSDLDIAQAIRYAVDNGADIINLSLGGYTSTFVLESAVEYATDNGVLVFAALGNDGADVEGEFYPACYSGVVGVTSTTSDGNASSFSNYDDNCADIAAPGSSIYSTLYTGEPAFGFDTDYGYLSGTSMATPVTAGVAGILLSQDDSLTDEQVIEYLVENTFPGESLGAQYGPGIVDTAAALDALIADNAEGSGEEEPEEEEPEEEVESGAPSAPTVTAWDSSEEETAYNAGQRYTDTIPYFSWNEPTDSDGIQGYYVYFGTSSTADPEDGTIQTARSYTPTELESADNQSYYLRVKAVDNTDAVSATASFEYVLDTEVTAPSGLQFVTKANGVQLLWNQVEDDTIVRYRIFRKKKKNGTFKRIKNRKSDKQSYIDKTVFNNQRYFYVVEAMDDLGNTARTSQKKIVFEARDRIVMAPGVGGAPLVRIYNTASGKYQRTWYAFDQSERGGAEIAVGQLDKDKKDEIAAARGEGFPEVRTFDANGKLKKNFVAYSPSFTGGVRLALGDTTGNGKAEIITVPGDGMQTEVKIWKANGTLIRSFNALGADYTGGAYVAALDWDGDGKAEIAVAPGAGGGRGIQIYQPNGKLITTVDVFTEGFNNGVRVAGGDFNKPKDRLIAAPATGSAFVEIYRKKGAGSVALQPGFFVYTTDYQDGLTVAAGNMGQKANDWIITGTNGRNWFTTVDVMTKKETTKDAIEPYGEITVPVNVATGWVF